MITPSLIAEAKAPVEPEKAARLAMLEVIRQTTDAIATFITKEAISSVITIRQPPMFEGATLTVTEYSSAPRQFNITFANLTPEARLMIESVANQKQLKQTLIEKGYTVQNIIIESAPRPVISPTSAETRRDGGGGPAPREFGNRDTKDEAGGSGGEMGGST